MSKSTRPPPSPSKGESLFGPEGDLDLSAERAHVFPTLQQPDALGETQLKDGWSVEREQRITSMPAALKSEQEVVRRETRPAPPPGQARPTMPVPHFEQNDPLTEVADRFALGDYAQALSLAELALGKDPDNTELQHYVESSSAQLIKHYATQLGTLERVFKTMVSASERRWLGADPQALLLLDLVDGERSLNAVLELSELSELVALRLLVELYESGAIQPS